MEAPPSATRSNPEPLKKPVEPMRVRMEALVKQLQSNITATLEKHETVQFKPDNWTREEGGYGISSILQSGTTFEKAGVNISVINGDLPDALKMQMRGRGKHELTGDYNMFATGISIVCHPHNPNVPTVHMNYRNEARGVGGIFFDDFDANGDPELAFKVVQKCGDSFIDSYIPILEKRMNLEYTPHMKSWQQLRRGRYVEFNLVNDRGTKFGLVTPGARIESVLMSLPLTARWEYMYKPDPDSKESQLLEVLKNPKEWC